MEIYRHRISGKYFVKIEEIDSDRAFFVNPESRILPVPEQSFWDESKEGDAGCLVAKGLITAEQAEKYRQYNSYREEDWRNQMRVSVENFKDVFASWTPAQKARFIQHLTRLIEN